MLRRNAASSVTAAGILCSCTRLEERWCGSVHCKQHTVWMMFLADTHSLLVVGTPETVQFVIKLCVTLHSQCGNYMIVT